MIHRIGLAVSLFLLSHIATTNVVHAADYVDATAYVSQGSKALGPRWYEMQMLLNEAFDDVCMDTFCEGDYTNLTSLAWRCSVDADNGTLGQCVWVFAGSAEFVDADTGDIDVDSITRVCPVPVFGDLQGLMESVLDSKHGNDSALNLLKRRVPGVAGTLYASLAQCL